MKLYWSHKSLPELAHLPMKERDEIWRVAYLNSITSWRVWASWGVFILMLSIGISASYQFGDAGSIELIKIGIAGVVALTIAWPLVFASVRPYIQAEANRRSRQGSSNTSLERTRER
jgi:hypothetical protein